MLATTGCTVHPFPGGMSLWSLPKERELAADDLKAGI
jgi:hypothetical protein